MGSTVSMTVKHRSDQGMSRCLLCHGLDSRREQPRQGSCHEVLLYPSGCPKCSWGCCTGTIKGPSSWALGWAVEGLSLSILFEEKIGLQDALFLAFPWLLFSIAVCSERQKWWINCNDFSSLSNTRVVQMQVSECQACFSIIRLHEQQRKKTAIKFVSCQEKLSSWRARRLGGEHAGTEGRRW